MSNLVKKLETNLSALSGLLGENNVEDMKKRISNIVVKAVEDDVKIYQKQSYTFYPPDYIMGIAEEVLDEAEKKIKKMYKDAMLDVATRSVEKYKDLVVNEQEPKHEIIGITRRVDDLGRIVIPREMRNNLKIKEGDPLEILVSKNQEIIIRKYTVEESEE